MNHVRSIDTIKFYWRQARKHRLAVVLVFLGVGAAMVIEMVIPLYYKQLFDLLGFSAIREKAIIDRMITLILIAIGLDGISWMLWRAVSFAMDVVSPKIMTDLLTDAYQYLQHHSYAFFTNHFVGALVKRVTRFSRAYELFAVKILWDLYPLAVRIVAALVVLWAIHRTLGLIMGVWVIAFLAFNYAFALWKLKYDRARAQKDSESTAVLADAMTNQSNVQLFNGYEVELNRYTAINNELRRLRTLTYVLGDVVEALQAAMMIAVELVLMLVAVRFWSRGELSIGTFYLLQAYLVGLFTRLWDFGRTVREVYESFADAEEMTQILLTPHDVKDTPTAVPLVIHEARIEFRDVSFSYHQTRRVLHHINLRIEPGEKVALIGPSGSGKTTLVKLLFRLYDIEDGKILIDGKRIHQATQESLHAGLSLVPQDPILFHRTLMENIRYGRPSAPDEEVIEAARHAHCDEFIETFPQKYLTYVGERGVKLSGGERQRVAIARAILRNAPILVLDEATSSLDSHSEALIQEALKELMATKTAIVIAHRLSTIQQMDRIIVLDRGRIAEEGTHASLLRQEGSMYKKLWELQVGGFLIDEEDEEDDDSLPWRDLSKMSTIEGV